MVPYPRKLSTHELLFTFFIARLTVQFPERPEVQLYTAASLEKLTFAFEDW